MADLTAALDDDHPTVRHHAATALAAIGEEEAPTPRILVESRFDAADDGWVYYHDAYDPMHHAAGGNPGGYISS